MLSAKNWREKSMASDVQFEEEEFSTNFNGKILLRILAQVKPHWRWVLGFLICVGIVSMTESFFTYLGKLIVDEGIVPGNRDALLHIMTVYGSLVFLQAGCVFTFIYLAGVLGQRVQYDMRQKMFSHLQD